LKDIILPWTCKTGDKIKWIIKWITLIVFPILTIIGILNWDKGFAFFLIPFAGVISIFAWMQALTNWDEEGELPLFRCKCDGDNN